MSNAFQSKFNVIILCGGNLHRAESDTPPAEPGLARDIFESFAGFVANGHYISVEESTFLPQAESEPEQAIVHSLA
eukprot:scaffold363821_cov18-Prasinocladus_malaysianus.AAC.1